MATPTVTTGTPRHPYRKRSPLLDQPVNPALYDDLDRITRHCIARERFERGATLEEVAGLLLSVGTPPARIPRILTSWTVRSARPPDAAVTALLQGHWRCPL